MRLARTTMIVATTAVLAFSAAPAVAAPTPQWHRELGRVLRAVAVDAGGNSYATGYVRSGARRLRTLVLAKFAPDGTRRWVRTWRPISGSETEGVDVAVGRDGRVYVTGKVHTLRYEGGGWVLRAYGPGGGLRWHRHDAGWRRGETSTAGVAVAVARGLVVLAGNDEACCGEIAHDGWLLAFDPAGRRRWTNPFEVPGLASSDVVTDVATGARGAVFAVGGVDQKRATQAKPDVDQEVMVARVDGANGSLDWVRVHREADDRDDDVATTVGVRGDVLAVGARVDGGPVTSRWAERGHAWLGRISLGGDLLWSRVWGERHATASEPAAVAIGPGGAIRVVGTTRGADDGVDAFLRTHAPTGARRSWVRIDVGRFLHGTGVAAAHNGGSVWVSAWRGTRTDDRPDGGRLWRYRP